VKFSSIILVVVLYMASTLSFAGVIYENISNHEQINSGFSFECGGGEIPCLYFGFFDDVLLEKDSEVNGVQLFLFSNFVDPEPHHITEESGYVHTYYNKYDDYIDRFSDYEFDVNFTFRFYDELDLDNNTSQVSNIFNIHTDSNNFSIENIGTSNKFRFSNIFKLTFNFEHSINIKAGEASWFSVQASGNAPLMWVFESSPEGNGYIGRADRNSVSSWSGSSDSEGNYIRNYDEANFNLLGEVVAVSEPPTLFLLFMFVLIMFRINSFKL
jgi:hypothetical protein